VGIADVNQPLGCASHSLKAGLQFYEYLIINYLKEKKSINN
jgi:hypothetical protein